MFASLAWFYNSSINHVPYFSSRAFLNLPGLVVLLCLMKYSFGIIINFYMLSSHLIDHIKKPKIHEDSFIL